RPDALVILDDNVVEQATLGLHDAGVHAGDHLQVYAHCNFPWPPPSAVPVHRIGYDVRQVLNVSLSLIDRQLAGEQTADLTRVAPHFEQTDAFVHEIPTIN